MAKSFEKRIFKQASKTYYYSTRFFPKRLRRDVSRLYSFVRIADDYVDEEPRQPEKIAQLEKEYQQALKADHFDPTTHAWDDQDARILKNIMRLTQRYKFDPAWVQSFLSTMKSDLKPRTAKTLKDTLDYAHGSAEVIGLMMANIMKLPEEAWEYAKLQGRAMQYLNFIRDIKEDTERGRQYLPQEDLDKVGLPDLKEETVREHPEAFKKFMQLQIQRYRQWQAEASKGHDLIPKRFRIPIQTAVEMFNWTADTIEKNPLIVYKKKVRPVSARVLGRGAAKKSKALSQNTARLAKRVSQGAYRKAKVLRRS
jgi:phytoene synthase